jgi:hypothetical protein
MKETSITVEELLGDIKYELCSKVVANAGTKKLVVVTSIGTTNQVCYKVYSGSELYEETTILSKAVKAYNEAELK